MSNKMSSSEEEFLKCIAGKSGGNNDYQDLRRLWKDAHPEITTEQTSDQRVAAFWKSNKDNSYAVTRKIEELNLKIRTWRNPIQAAFLKQYQKSQAVNSSQPKHSLPSEPSRSEREEPGFTGNTSFSSSLPSEPLRSEQDEPELIEYSDIGNSLLSEPSGSEREVFGLGENSEIRSVLPSEFARSERGKAVYIENVDNLNNSLPQERQIRGKMIRRARLCKTAEQEVTIEEQQRNTPAQQKCKNELNQVNREIVELTRIKDTGLFFTNEMGKKLKHLRTHADKLQTNLKKLKSNSEAAVKSRVKRKQQLESIKELLPESVATLGRTKKGRPCLEEKQTGLTKAILDIVSRNCNADEKRRCETLMSNMRLKDLLVELKSIGFQISRNGLSLRFKPRNKTTHWGRRHVSTVNVKLAKATNTSSKKHSDTHFAAGTIMFLHDIAELFGNESVTVISIDDKAKVPLGITAAKSQSPILMRMDYEVRLPDHDFVVGSGHKLTPSVYAGLVIKDKKLSYSGPTLIAIRSGKHDSSTAESHANDLDRFLSLPHFDYFSKYGGAVKPIMIILTDGGPDENPRFPKTLQQAIRHFKRYNLDALFIATNAPGQSQRNPVERRMAPLSRDLVAVILPYEHFGTHLNSGGKTFNKDLEVKNFDKAGHVLANIWNGKVIDGHQVIAEYVHPPSHPDCLIHPIIETGECSSDQSNVPPETTGSDRTETDFCTIEDFYSMESDEDSSKDTSPHIPTRVQQECVNTNVTEEWKVIHVRQSQYFLQITKCFNSNCCEPPRTNLLRFLPEKFVPAPVLYASTEHGMHIADVGSSEGHFMNLPTRLSMNFLKIPNALQPLPFDWFCPSLQSKISQRICNTCGIYFPSKVALKTHTSLHTGPPRSNIQVAENIDNVLVIDEEDDGIIVIEDMDAWLSPTFVEVDI